MTREEQKAEFRKMLRAEFELWEKEKAQPPGKKPDDDGGFLDAILDLFAPRQPAAK